MKGIALAAGLGLGTMGMAQAQEVIEITPDDQVLVERYVRAVPVPPPIIEEHMTLRPGSVIPEAVPLRRFEGQPALERYAYFVSVDGKIVVADPRSRVVVRILDRRPDGPGEPPIAPRG